MNEPAIEAIRQEIVIDECHHQYEHLQLQMESIYHSAITLCEIHDSLANVSVSTFSEEMDQGYRLAIQHVITDPFSLEINKTDNLSNHLVSSLYEGTKKLMVELWEAIKNIFFKALRAVRDFLSQLLQGVDGLERVLDKQLDRLEDIEKDQKRSGQGQSVGASTWEGITISGGSRIHMGDEINGEDLKKGLSNLDMVSKNITSSYLHTSQEILEALKSVSKDLSQIGQKEQNVDKVKDQVKDLKEKPVILFNTLKDQIRDYRDKELPGGMRIKIQDVQFSSRGIPTTMPRVDLQPFEADSRNKERNQAEVLSLDLARDVIGRVRDLLQYIRTGQQQIASINDDYKKTIDTKDRILNRSDVVQSIEANFAEQEKAIIMSMYRMGLPDQSITRTYRYMYGVARASVNYVKKSLDQYR